MTDDSETDNGIDDLDDILAGYIDRLNSGEMIRRDDVLLEHPEHGEKILAEIEAFREMGLSDEPSLGQLGDYRLVRRIGAGGMGIVYEAWQGSMERPVALKVLPTGVAADSRAFVRFMREARSAGKLRHPNIVSVHGMGVESDTPYCAMELIEGATLRQIFAGLKMPGSPGEPDRLRRLAGILRGGRDGAAAEDARKSHRSGSRAAAGGEGRSDAACAAERFAEVAEGLAHAHEHGVIHRDIKPSNLIREDDGRIRILDFGLAQLEGEESLTRTGGRVGTPAYMSPEQARQRKIRVDHRSDIYSLGVTMYEALTGRVPFEGGSVDETLSRIIRDEPPAPRKLNPAVPRDLETIVLQCLRKDPERRYASAMELARDLRRFARDEPVRARPRPPWETIVPRLRPRRPVRAAFFVLLGALLVGGYVVLAPREFAELHVGTLPVRASPYDVSRVSRDGRFLPYIDWNANSVAVYDLVEGEGRALVRVGGLGSHDAPGGVAVSRDGAWVAYAYYHALATTYSLRVVEIDGSGDGELGSLEAGYLRPLDWAPGHDALLVSIPDDRRLVELSFPEGRLSEIPLPGDFKGLLNAAFSPHGHLIAFEAIRATGCGRDVFVVPRAGGEPRPLVERPSDERLIDWTPAADGVVFSSDGDPQGGLWLVPVDAEGKRRGDDELLKQPFSHLAFQGGITGAGRLHYTWWSNYSDVRLAGTDAAGGIVEAAPPLSASYRGHADFCSWDPRGERLAYRIHPYGAADFMGNGTQAFAICDVARGSESERRLDPRPRFRPGTRLWGPRWSPDGSSLLVSGHGCDEGLGIYTVDPQSGDTVLLNPTRDVTFPVQSSDDGAVYWVGKVENRRRAILRHDGNEKTVIYRVERPEEGIHLELDLSPPGEDGERLVFVVGNRHRADWYVRVLPLAGGEPQEVPVFEEGVRDGEIMAPFVRWSHPEGDALYYLLRRSQPDAELWRMELGSGHFERTLVGRIPGLRIAVPHPQGNGFAVVTQVFDRHGKRPAGAIMRMENFLPRD